MRHASQAYFASKELSYGLSVIVVRCQVLYQYTNLTVREEVPLLN